MSIIANDTRYGLDKKLYKLQTSLNNKIGEANAVIYALLHENDRKQGRVLEWPTKESEVFVDDRESFVIGFRLISKKVGNFDGLATLDVICTTQTANRELTELTIYKYLTKSGLINTIDTTIKIGINQVFTGLFTDDIKFRDIYPFHVFAYTIEVPYPLDICP